MAYIRPQRAADALRSIHITPDFLPHTDGSVLIACGNTQIICTASIDDRVPPFLKGTGQGWITAEYSMLPAATATRNRREATTGKQTGRTQEIQRLIGRSLRAGVDLSLLSECQITLDCDVIRADGGTRTASITGAFVALSMALAKRQQQGLLPQSPLRGTVSAISVGVLEGTELLDLDYPEDAQCDSDINLVMLNGTDIIEIQGTAEGAVFSPEQLQRLIALGQQGIKQLITIQQHALNLAKTS